MSIAEVILKITDRGSAALKKVGEEGRKTDKVMGKLVGSAAAAGAGFTAAGGALVAFAQHMADAVNDINDMSARTGVSAETLGVLRVMAEATGREFQDLNEVINPLIARMGQVASGNESVAKQFKSLGVEVLDANGNMRTADDVLTDVIGTLGGIQDPTERAAAAVTLLGESGGKLVQIMGAGEFDAFADFTANFGLRTGPEAAKAAADWQVSMALLKTTVEGFASSIASYVGPTVQKWLDDFTLGFVATTTFIATLFEELTAGLRQTFDQMGKDITAFLAKLTPGRLIKAALSGGLSELFEESTLQGDALRILGTTEAGLAQSLSSALERARDDAFGAGQLFFENRGAVRASGMAPGAGGTSGVLTSIADADKAAKEKEKAEKEAAKAAEETAKRIREAQAALSDFADAAVMQNLKDFELIAAQRDADVKKVWEMAAAEGDFLAESEDARRALAAIDQKYDALEKNLRDRKHQEEMDRIEAEIQAQLSRNQAAVGMTIQGLSGDLGGLIGGLGAVAGPAGMIAAQVVQGIEAIGALGAEGVGEKLDEFGNNLIAGLQALPDIIGDVLPRFVAEFVPALTLALVEALPDLLVAQAEAFVKILIAQFRDIPMAIAEGLTNAFFDLWEVIKEFFRDLFSFRFKEAFGGKEGGLGKTVGKGLRIGAAVGTLGLSEIAIAIGKGIKNATEGRSFARGGVIDRTGLAMVHKGERVVRPNGGMSGTTRSMDSGGGGGIVIVPTGIMTMRDLIEQVRRELGDRGSGMTLDPITT